jgi:hypothetical protein
MVNFKSIETVPVCQSNDYAAMEAGFQVGEPLSHNPQCPECHLCNALVMRNGRLKCRMCLYVQDADVTAELESKTKTVVVSVNLSFAVPTDYVIDGNEYLRMSYGASKGVQLARDGEVVSDTISTFTTQEIFAGE